MAVENALASEQPLRARHVARLAAAPHSLWKRAPGASDARRRPCPSGKTELN